MKSINKIGIIVILTMCCLSFSQNTFAGDFWRRIISSNGGHNHGTGSVGAPIDGGILALLAAAGAGYFLIRKKNNKKSE